LSNIGRQIKNEEKGLIIFLLNLADRCDLVSLIPDLIYDMDDGEMGGIMFTNDIDRVYEKDLIQVNYVDSDKTLVIITLTLDNSEELFELDFWKVNFDKLIKYPLPNEIKMA
jgi:hypothetical protein